MARITFEGKRYPLREDETALDAMLRGGANVAFSCRRGTCHVCMLRAIGGDPGPEAQKGLRAELRERGYFLPCTAKRCGEVDVVRPNPSELFVRARVECKELVSPKIARILLEPEINLTWRAGQFVNVRRASDGLVRSYSIASVPDEDYFLELHVKRIDDGAMSGWLFDRIGPGDELEIQGPVGACFYPADMDRTRPMLLLGTGTGLSPLIGVARDALLRGHTGPITIVHGGREPESLYFGDRLRALEARHPNFRYVPCLSGKDVPDGITRGRVVDVAFTNGLDLEHAAVFLAGIPDMVHEARCRAILGGAKRADIHADPFDFATPYVPDDSAKIAGIAPDPELWKALEEGPGLSRLLHDFYGRVYEDPRLAPFFHKVTKARAIEKQYEFLRDLFTGERKYFGLRPFNAHHWMVISDELFDYREALMEDCMRRYGLTEPLIRRWSALHEKFRREIVKATQRGLILNGVEQPIEGYTEEPITFGTLCDGCGGEMPIGATGRMHVRTGELFCSNCVARHVGFSAPPPAA